MKNLNREAIKRMTESRGGSVGGGGGSEPISLAGYATQIWTEQNYISKLFFNRLFTVLDEDGNAIEPNDTETVIESIQSMFGFWSNLYISALGQGSGGSAAITLGMLEDVQLTSPQNGQVLKFDGTKWVNGEVGGGGVDMRTIWENLAASGSQQINASHLSNALSSYATQTWVTQQGYLTASSISDMATKSWVNSQISDMATKTWVNSQISDMATKTWVSNNYLGLHATADAAAKLATARTLWGQSFDGTGNVDGLISINPGSTSGYTEGIRIHSSSGGWTTLMFCGTDNTGNSGTSANSWSMHTNGGNFYLNKNGSDSHTGNEFCNVSGKWGIGVIAPSEKLHVDGNILANGDVTALSDIRKKNVIGDIELDVNAIALARLIRFTWKDGHDTDEHVGGIAQEWQKILPEAVHESADGTLSMDYGAIGMISAVTLARKVVEQERRLEMLEARIKRLENIL